MWYQKCTHSGTTFSTLFKTHTKGATTMGYPTSPYTGSEDGVCRVTIIVRAAGYLGIGYKGIHGPF